MARLLYVWGFFWGGLLIAKAHIPSVVSQGLPSALARILELIILLSMLAFPHSGCKDLSSPNPLPKTV